MYYVFPIGNIGSGPISSNIALLGGVDPGGQKIPSPVSGFAEIVHTIHHTYHVPSPPDYVKVHVPGPTVVKPVREPRDPEGVHDSGGFEGFWSTQKW